VVLDKKNDVYVVKLGTMGEQANAQIIYKPTWFYAHFPSLERRILHNDVISELNPIHQGRNLALLERIREDNQCAIIRAVGTQLDTASDQIHIVGHVVATGPHFSTVEQMFDIDPQGESWAFRLRCLVQPPDEGASKKLVPVIERLITWDLHTH
jgi:hypothetical protein